MNNEIIDIKPVVLIVDDREENLIALEAVLSDLDIQIEKARSGEETLTYLLHKEAALILLDVQMPGMNGYETAELIRSRKKTKLIPIIFVTAISREDKFVFKGYETGAIDYLLKPIDPYILKSKTNVFMQLYKKEIQLKNMIIEREMLIREIHHRVKNNLSTLISLIHIQNDQYGESEKNRDLLEIESRIRSILAIHEKLYNSDSLTSISLNSYIEGLIPSVISSMETNKADIDFQISCEKIKICPDDIVNLGLILTEMAINSMKYAFNDTNEGIISIACTEKESEITISYNDSGPGISSQLKESKEGLGIKIIDTMIFQLKGKIVRSDNPGCEYSIIFSLK